MSDTASTPPSQPTDPTPSRGQALVARFEPARAAVAPLRCNLLLRDCWVRTAKAQSTGKPTCGACHSSPNLPGNEAKHAAVLRRCMAAQNKVAP